MSNRKWAERLRVLATLLLYHGTSPDEVREKLLLIAEELDAEPERNAVLEDAAKECLKRVGDTLTNDECCYGMANAIRALKNNAAPDCNATLEAWTFIDAVSAMGFPPQWAYVAEEANRIRALKNKAD